MIKKPKIRFIDPQGRPGRPFNIFLKRYPPLGATILATILHQRGYDSAVYNENFTGPVDQDAAIYRDICSADVVGISIMTPTALRGYRIADQLRRDAPDVRIIFGGVHATFCPEEALKHGDVVCRGEGENVIEKMLLGEIRSGIVDAPPVADLDVIPPPDHFLIRGFEEFLKTCYKRELFELPIATSRGCPYGCVFCSVTKMFGGTVRRQSPAKIERDLRHYRAQGFRFVFLYDDNFISDREWAKDVLGRMRPLKLRFNAQVRIDFSWTDRARTHRDRGILQALKDAGCSGLIMGYETLDDETAKEWHKGYPGLGTSGLEQQLLEDTQVLHDYGFWTYGMFVIGPQHTQRTVDRIVRFARRSQLHSLQVTILTPLPGTRLFEEMRPHLIVDRFPEDWDYYDVTHCVWGNGRMSPEEASRAVLGAHKRYYRVGGWNARSIRHVARRRIPVTDRVMDLYTRFRGVRGIFGRWEAEINEYLAMLKKRTGG